MELLLGNNIIASYKRLSYTPWYAFAEFVDNSTQSYLNHRATLDPVLEKEGQKLWVKIDYSPEDGKITIKDNSMGMSREELAHALIIGRRPADTSGRSKYGLGMKTAACWLGDAWSVKTKKLGEGKWYKVSVNVQEASESESGPIPLPEEEGSAPVEEHYTEITISMLNRKFKGRTNGKIREYLQSFYRGDFAGYGLQLYWKGEVLQWDDLSKYLYVQRDDSVARWEFSFPINTKSVSGWVGVLGKGKAGRKNAGFSIIQSGRVIHGWPDGFKPTTMYGDEGRNDLINQRVVGEIFLASEFAVSHTKDSIVWLDDEFDLIEDKLKEESEAAMQVARTARFKEDRTIEATSIKQEVMAVLERELESTSVTDFLNTVQPEPEDILAIAEDSIVRLVESKSVADLNATIGVGGGALQVLVYFDSISVYEPYVIIEAGVDSNRVLVMINALHPHVAALTSSDLLLNFVRHCVYDGVAEWKAMKLLGSIQPHTIKMLKDKLLRLPYSI